MIVTSIGKGGDVIGRHTQGLWCYINVLLWLVTDYADVCSIVILWGEYRFLEPGWEKHCPRPSKWIHQKLKIPHHYFPHIWFSHFGKRIGHQYSKMSHQPRGKAGLASHHLLSLLWANLWGKNTHSHFHRNKSQYINSACYLNPRLGKKYFSIRNTIVQMRFFPQKKKKDVFFVIMHCSLVQKEPGSQTCHSRKGSLFYICITKGCSFLEQWSSLPPS